MTLFEDMMVPCTEMVKARTPDGEGGHVTTWVPGSQFLAAIHMETSVEARVAEREGKAEAYIVTTARDEALAFHDVFKRDSDGKVFRVTSDPEDRRTPKMASFAFARVTAEEWSLS